jgi:hypothetical protein
MESDQNSDVAKLAFLSAAVAAAGLYDLATSSAAPSIAGAILQYILMACMLIGLLGLAGWVIKCRSKA